MVDNTVATTVKTQPPDWRLKLIGLMCSFAALGLVESIFGPTLIDLEEYLGTDTSGMSITLIMGSLGAVCGSALCGYVYDRFQLELQLLLETVLMGIFTAASPWPRNVVAFGAFKFVGGVVSGLLDATAQGYLIYLMSGHPLLNPAMQLIHASWSVGGFIGPFIASPFLSGLTNLPSVHGNFSTLGMSINLTKSDVTTSSIFNLNTRVTSSVGTDYPLNKDPTGAMGMFKTSPDMTCVQNTPASRVPFCYLIVGIVAAILAAPLLVAFLRGHTSCIIANKSGEGQHSEKDSSKEKSRSFRVTLNLLLFFWFFFYAAVEQVTGTFIASFVVRELNWTRDIGSMITSVLWGATGVGRILAVPIAVFASPRQMLVASMTLSTAAFAILLTLTRSHAYLVWVGVGMLGFGISFSFATMVLWASGHLHIGGITAAIILVGTSSGIMISIPLTGYLFQYLSPIWMMYIGLAASVLDIFIYLSAEFFVYFNSTFRNTQMVKPLSFKSQTKNDYNVEECSYISRL